MTSGSSLDEARDVVAGGSHPAQEATAASRLGRRSAGRYMGIDAGRFVCCLAVVFIHTTSSFHFQTGASASPPPLEAGRIIDQLSRFAVPYFFIASGFFSSARPEMSRVEQARLIVLRIGPPFLLWAAIFNLVTFREIDLFSLGFWFRFVSQGGTAPHLWYLPAMLIWLVVLTFTRGLVPIRYQALGGVGLFLAGLAFGPYAELISGRVPSAVQAHIARDLFLAPVFIVFGHWLRDSGWRPSFRAAMGLFLIGGVLQLAECYALFRHNPAAGFGHDFVGATSVFATGAFCMALTWPKTCVVPTAVADLGLLALGFYAIHPLFIDALALVLPTTTLAMRLLLALLVDLLGFATVAVLARCDPLRRFVL